MTPVSRASGSHFTTALVTSISGLGRIHDGQRIGTREPAITQQ
jgi:hypothetical protein